MIIEKFSKKGLEREIGMCIVEVESNHYP